MAIIFSLEPSTVAYDDIAPSERARHGVRCMCGRFAHFVSTRYALLGDYSEFRVTVRCAACGLREVY